ncbi:MAG: DUF4388 domain-containing protein [Myxococcota bacterium]|nr:DUF4388 domain-containing protein [Myxococcota bacterium]
MNSIRFVSILTFSKYVPFMSEIYSSTTTGIHSPEQYIRLLFTYVQQKQSGLLSVDSSRNLQQLILIEGNIVSSKSQKPLLRMFVEQGVITEEQWTQAQQKATDQIAPEEILLRSGVLSEQDFDEYQNLFLSQAITKPLLWNRGRWSFHPKPFLSLQRIENRLRDVPSAMLALWQGVQKLDEELMNGFASLLKGRLTFDEATHSILQDISEYESLESIVNESTNPETAMTIDSLLDKEPSSRRLLWFLFHLGLLSSSNVDSAETVTKPLPVRARSKEDNRKKNISIIRSDYRRRMGKDYYTFLKIDSQASQPQIDREIRRLLRRWGGYKDSVRQEPEVLQKLQQLLDGLAQIQQTLSDPQNKKDYDRKLRFNKAPYVGEISKEDSEKSELLRLMQLVEQSRFEEALPLLKDLQTKVGLNADILTQIGWCLWNLGSQEEAEDSIKFALGLYSHHILELEYDARIALAQAQPMRARKRLISIIGQDERHAWASETLNNISIPPVLGDKK